jgi:hypothetical protein
LFPPLLIVVGVGSYNCLTIVFVLGNPAVGINGVFILTVVHIFPGIKSHDGGLVLSGAICEPEYVLQVAGFPSFFCTTSADGSGVGVGHWTSYACTSKSPQHGTLTVKGKS